MQRQGSNFGVLMCDLCELLVLLKQKRAKQSPKQKVLKTLVRKNFGSFLWSEKENHKVEGNWSCSNKKSAKRSLENKYFKSFLLDWKRES
jgi:hypothetical protein